MKTNKSIKTSPMFTHEGAKAYRINTELQLRRSVLSCLLFEDTFYEDGESIADRIAETVPKVKPEVVAAIAVEAREQMKLRHVPLEIVRCMAGLDSHKHLVAETLARVIQRADELTEYLALYWKNGRCPVSAQSKRGLAAAYKKFNEHQLAKYDRDGQVKLRDVMFISHPKPDTPEQEAVWKRLVDGKLRTPDTWEVALSASAGENKKEIWERLLKEKRLGALALLRNLRNCNDAGVGVGLVRAALAEIDITRVLPFRFIAAARYNPGLEPELETAMFGSVSAMPRLTGHTVVLVDVSGSMDDPLSSRSDMTCMDAACGVAMVCRELCDTVSVYTFSMQLEQVPTRRGFALRDAIVQSQEHSGTYLGQSLNQLHQKVQYDRIIVITDEQVHDRVSSPNGIGYMINVSTNQNGVGYGAWTHIDGFSENVLRYITELELGLELESTRLR